MRAGFFGDIERHRADPAANIQHALAGTYALDKEIVIIHVTVLGVRTISVCHGGFALQGIQFGIQSEQHAQRIVRLKCSSAARNISEYLFFKDGLGKPSQNV
jgi:hypothetical protein